MQMEAHNFNITKVIKVKYEFVSVLDPEYFTYVYVVSSFFFCISYKYFCIFKFCINVWNV